MKWLFIAGVYLLAVVAQAHPPYTHATPADIEGRELLDKMLNSVEQLNYQGTFVFEHSGQIHTMQIVHGVDNGNVQERLIALSGEPREVLRNGDIVTSVWPQRNLVTVDAATADHSVPAIVPRELETLAQNYRVLSGSRKRVAGHDCQLLSIKPFDRFRYGYELCIAPENGMLLRAKMFHPQQGLLEEVIFTQVEYLDSIDPERFVLANDIANYTRREASHNKHHQLESVHHNHWQVANLPPGFSVSNINQRNMATSDEPVQHMVVSDGVASVSVFIVKPRQPIQVYEGLIRRGSINAFSRGFDDHQITVLGEVPNETVKMIGLSVVHAEQ